jgi:hypothetical protein
LDSQQVDVTNRGPAPRRLTPLGCGLALGGLGACAGSVAFAAVLMGIGVVEQYSTAQPVATSRGPVGDWLFASLVVGAFAFAFAAGPGMVGGIWIAYVLRRLRLKGTLNTRTAALTGLVTGAVMGLLLVALFLVYERTNFQGVLATAAILTLLSMVITSTLLGMVVALILRRSSVP